VSAPRAGFSLVELLVVLAIIAILAALLFPVFATARGKAAQAVCLANLQQIGMALELYAQDFDQCLPDEYVPWRGGYPDVVQPYLRDYRVFVCPQQSEATHVSYGLPEWNASAARYWGVVRLTQVGSPAEAILLAENTTSWYSTRDPAHSVFFPPDGNVAWTRHAGGANYLFLDGHGKWLTRGQTYRPVCLWWPWPHAPVGECEGRAY
jgi:prepilin-type N-terminal cleavage/methylation domain-containing protein/prepilin-type processing-associated H-X9-DG protein